MIGNDVVDLELAATQSNWQRKGFLEKVFSPLERESILSSEDKSLMVWLLWTMKEAAYKAHQRENMLPRKLNWHRQECELTMLKDSKASGKVKIDGKLYYSNSTFISGVIHTTVVKDPNIPCENRFLKTSSKAMKEDFFKTASALCKLPKEELFIEKNESGIPFLLHHRQKLPYAISFSGHGRFSAFAISLMNC